MKFSIMFVRRSGIAGCGSSFLFADLFFHVVRTKFSAACKFYNLGSSEKVISTQRVKHT